MKDDTKNCAICKKEIKTSLISVGRSGIQKGSGNGNAAKHTVSDEGTYLITRWFCNDCLKDMKVNKMGEYIFKNYEKLR